MILKQSGNSVTILAQFNPEKFKDTTESLSSQSEATTTCSTPINRKRRGSSNTPPIRRNGEILPIIDNEPPGDLRYVFFTKSPSSLGFSIAGGNAMGIFVSEIQPNDTAANSSGLKVGDHILEVRIWNSKVIFFSLKFAVQNQQPLPLPRFLKGLCYENISVDSEPKFCHITPILWDLHWLPVRQCIDFKIIK